MTLDLEKLTTTNPLLAGEGLISICEAAKAIGLSDGSLIGELLNDRVAVYTYAQHWQGWHVKDSDLLEREPDGGFVLNSVEALGTRLAHSGLVRSFSPRETLSSLLAEGKATESVFRLPGSAAFFTDAEAVISSPAWMVQKAAVEHIRDRLARATSPDEKKSASAPEKPVSEAMAGPGGGTTKHGKKRFSELFELYRNHRKWGEDQKRRMATEARLFIELMDDPPLGEIELETIHEYAKRLLRLPPDVYLFRRRLKVESLHELMAVAERESLPRKNAKTVRGHVGRIAEILNFASTKGMMTANPASGFQREWSVGKKTRPQDERDEFTPDELTLIFSQAWFANGAGTFSAKGRTNWRPYYFWLPLLALITGGRLNELAQLYLDDVRQSDKDGAVWYIDFNLNEPDKIDADEGDYEPDKSLKTVNSIRVVPLHEIAVKAGLPEYVAALRKAGHIRLFPELTRDKVKGYGKPAGSWFNERLLGRRLSIERNGRKTFHSLRHNFATTVERLDLPERVMAQLLGHERGQTQSGTRYAKDRNAAELKPIIDRLAFPSLANVGKFNVPAAMRALKWVVRFKATIERAKATKGEL